MPGISTVNYKGTQFTGDVFVVQIAVWNAGREPMRTDDVIKSIVLRFPTNCVVLQAKTIKTQREVIGWNLDTPTNAFLTGISLKWKVLEHNDGALILVIYSDPLNAPIGCEGGCSWPRVSRMVNVAKSVC